MTFQIPPGATEVTLTLTIDGLTLTPHLEFVVPPSDVAFSIEVHVEDEATRAELRALIVRPGRVLSLTVTDPPPPLLGGA